MEQQVLRLIYIRALEVVLHQNQPAEDSFMVQQHQVVVPTYLDPPLQLVEARFQVVSVKQEQWEVLVPVVPNSLAVPNLVLHQNQVALEVALPSVRLHSLEHQVMELVQEDCLVVPVLHLQQEQTTHTIFPSTLLKSRELKSLLKLLRKRLQRRKPQWRR